MRQVGSSASHGGRRLVIVAKVKRWCLYLLTIALVVAACFATYVGVVIAISTFETATKAASIVGSIVYLCAAIAVPCVTGRRTRVGGSSLERAIRLGALASLGMHIVLTPIAIGTLAM